MSSFCQCEVDPEYIGFGDWSCPECCEEYSEAESLLKRVAVRDAKIATLQARLDAVEADTGYCPDHDATIVYPEGHERGCDFCPWCALEAPPQEPEQKPTAFQQALAEAESKMSVVKEAGERWKTSTGLPEIKTIGRARLKVRSVNRLEPITGRTHGNRDYKRNPR